MRNSYIATLLINLPNIPLLHANMLYHVNVYNTIFIEFVYLSRNKRHVLGVN